MLVYAKIFYALLPIRKSDITGARALATETDRHLKLNISCGFELINCISKNNAHAQQLMEKRKTQSSRQS